MNNKQIAAIVVVVVIIVVAAAACVVVFTGDDDDDEGTSNLGGFYSWNPVVVEVNGDYSNLTPAFMTIAETVYTEVYGPVPSYSGISISDIPSKYLYQYTDYVISSDGDSTTVLTFDNTSTGTSEAYVQKTINTPTKVIGYTDCYIDTIYMIMCDYYGEVAHSGNSPKAEAALWDMVPAMTSSVKSGLEDKFGLTVPSSVEIIGSTAEDLVAYCDAFPSDERLLILMTEYNIRSTSSSSWWDVNQAIEANSPNIQFLYLLSNSQSMVMSSIEMVGVVIGYDSTENMMTSILAEIYVMQKAIDEMYPDGNTPTFYCETAAVASVGSDTLMGSIFADILKMQNVYDGSLMGSKMSDEDIVLAEPDVLGFYTSDTRSMDEKMRVARP